MEALGAFGLFGFIIAIVAFTRVQRLERVLRENGIRSQSGRGLEEQLRSRLGQTLTLSMYTSDGDVVGKTCKLLDVDGDWALVLVNEGKKRQSEKLIRLDDIKQLKS